MWHEFIFMQTGRMVAVSAAMKSGLKDVARVYIHADRTDGSSECRDEKRTERCGTSLYSCRPDGW